jgi:hypothetical protein
VSAADTYAPVNDKEDSNVEGGFIMTISPVAAPAIVTDVSLDVRVKREAGSTATVPFITRVKPTALAPGVKPFVDTIGPEKCVALIF